MNKQLYALLVVGLILLAAVVLLRFGDFGTKALWNLSNSGKWLLLLVGIAALIDSINPCAFSILLLTIAFLFSVGAARSGILKIGGLYILGIFVAYILIGLGIMQALHLFNTPHFMAKVGALLLILFGAINLVNEAWPAFPIKLKIPQAAHLKIAELMKKSSAPAAFLLGTLVGLCEFPCTGGPYLMVLGLLHDKATYFSGLAYLVLYNLVFVLPLVIILLIASNSGLLGKIQQWKKENMRQMKLWSGLAMVALGVIILFI